MKNISEMLCSKKRVINNGIVPQYYVENSHEPITPREIFMQVQEETVRRVNIQTGKSGKRRVYSSKYALSSIVYCGECGKSTCGCIGTTEDINPSSGGASAVLMKRAQILPSGR